MEYILAELGGDTVAIPAEGIVEFSTTNRTYDRSVVGPDFVLGTTYIGEEPFLVQDLRRRFSLPISRQRENGVCVALHLLTQRVAFVVDDVVDFCSFSQLRTYEVSPPGTTFDGYLKEWVEGRTGGQEYKFYVLDIDRLAITESTQIG